MVSLGKVKSFSSSNFECTLVCAERAPSTTLLQPFLIQQPRTKRMWCLHRICMNRWIDPFSIIVSYIANHLWLIHHIIFIYRLNGKKKKHVLWKVLKFSWITNLTSIPKPWIPSNGGEERENLLVYNKVFLGAWVTFSRYSNAWYINRKKKK